MMAVLFDNSLNFPGVLPSNCLSLFMKFTMLSLEPNSPILTPPRAKLHLNNVQSRLLQNLVRRSTYLKYSLQTNVDVAYSSNNSK